MHDVQVEVLGNRDELRERARDARQLSVGVDVHARGNGLERGETVVDRLQACIRDDVEKPVDLSQRSERVVQASQLRQVEQVPDTSSESVSVNSL